MAERSSRQDGAQDGGGEQGGPGEGSTKRLCICMVSDFFWPNVGGVETHIYQLSHHLINRGHKVVMVTHAYGQRTGVRFLKNGLKVYYLAYRPFHNENTFPDLWVSFPLLRHIWIREGVDIVHGHQAYSSQCHQALLHAGTMGLPRCFTDHSLFGFAEMSSINVNKLQHFSMASLEHAVCVSHTSRENTVLRTALLPDRVSVIPNAIESARFTPCPSARPANRVVVVVVSRLVYRKGVDLLRAVIPQVCARYPNVDFLIAGTGNRAVDIEEMRDNFQLHDRVRLVGAVANHRVRDVLVQGHIFLNCSLTEAFCMAIVEAASAGLLVVTTNVGGVPEVLPPDMCITKPPTVECLLEGVEEAVERWPSVDPFKQHERLKDVYRWDDVAARTELVYHKIKALPREPLATRLFRHYTLGSVAGKLFCTMLFLDWLVLRVIAWVWPEEGIQRAPTLSVKALRDLGSVGVSQSSPPPPTPQAWGKEKGD